MHNLNIVTCLFIIDFNLVKMSHKSYGIDIDLVKFTVAVVYTEFTRIIDYA